MKSLERKNEDLRDEIAIRDETIEQLQSNIKQMEVEHQKQIQEVKHHTKRRIASCRSTLTRFCVTSVCRETDADD